MAILVTGGAGYIGSHMVHALVDTGEAVVVLDNLSTGFRFLIPAAVPFVAGSTGDRDLVIKTLQQHKITEILHFAASIVVPDSMKDPLGYYRNNTMNTCMLLDAAVEAGVKHFIFSSTAAVYGNASGAQVKENAPTPPISPYGTSKLMSEIMLHDVARAHGLNFVMLRYFNVAGADPKLRTGQSTPARHASDQGRLRNRARTPPQARSLRHGLSDARRDLRARLHPRQRSCARASGGAFASAPRRLERHIQLRLWPRPFGARSDRSSATRQRTRISRRARSRRPGDPAILVADVSRIRATLDWRPQFDDLDTIVTHALAWERRLSGRRDRAAV